MGEREHSKLCIDALYLEYNFSSTFVVERIVQQRALASNFMALDLVHAHHRHLPCITLQRSFTANKQTHTLLGISQTN